LDISDIESHLVLIFKKRARINFETQISLRDEKLLGKKVAMPARELILALYDIEKEFNIKIKEKYLTDGYFDTYNHIAEIIKESFS